MPLFGALPRSGSGGVATLFCVCCWVGWIGCATHYNWHASVPTHGTVGERCMAEALAAEPDVFDVAETGLEQFAFRMQMPNVSREDSPSFSLHRTRDIHGDPALTLATSYAEGTFSSGGTQRARAGDLILSVAELCTGRRPTLGEPEPCGAGEPHDLCILGRYVD